MIRRFTPALITTLALTSTATGALADDGRIRVVNQVPFDVASCERDALTLERLTNNELAIALALVQPRVLECLTPATARGPAERTDVAITLTVTDAGATFDAKGDNLTPEGASCITAGLSSALTVSATPKGNEPRTLTAQLSHELGTNPGVRLGVNAPSDWVAAVRTSLMSHCDCYSAFAGKRPPLLTAQVQFTGGKITMAFDKSATPEGDVLAACLAPHLLALPAPTSKTEFRFPLRLVHTHSADTRPAPELGPELEFAQAELARLRLLARSQRALSDRSASAKTYDGLVTEYKRSKKASLVPTLTERCGALVTADEGWLEAAQRLLTHERALTERVTTLAASDAAWAPVAEAMASSIEASTRDVAQATASLSADKNACPKTR